MSEIVVQLPDETRAFIDEQVASQRLASASDYIVSLVEQAKVRAEVDRIDGLLLEGIASGPGEEATPEWWAATKQQWRQHRNGNAGQ